jgi:dTDP-4-dehydrorhamnose reductase
MLSKLPNVGVARIRIPADYIPHPANIIDKLVSFKQVADVANSITVIEDMQKAFLHMIENKISGIYHCTNPGYVSYRELMNLYRIYVDSSHKNEWISEQGLIDSGLVKCKRSNNILNVDKTKNAGIIMRDVYEAITDTLIKYANYKKI